MAQRTTTYGTANGPDGRRHPAPRGLVTGEAAEADVPGIMAVLEDAFRPFAGQFRPTALKQTPESVREGIGGWMVARLDGRVVACLMHYVEQEALIFCFLSVKTGLRGRGYADALVRAVLERARADRFPRVQVVLRRTLSANVRYFTSRGFHFLEPYETGAHDVYQLPLGATAKEP